jgi:hypothetical protein
MDAVIGGALVLAGLPVLVVCVAHLLRLRWRGGNE